MSMPVRLCTHDLPTGKLCRQVALKGEQVCRHHMRNFRHGMYEITRQEAAERLEARLNQMNLSELLLTLERKLNRIQKTIPAWDEARITLRIALRQLKERNEEDAMLLEFSQRHPLPDMNSPEWKSLMEKLNGPMR